MFNIIRFINFDLPHKVSRWSKPGHVGLQHINFKCLNISTLDIKCVTSRLRELGAGRLGNDPG